MTVDRQALQSSIDMLEAQVARLRRIVQEAVATGEPATGADGGLTDLGVDLPAEVVVRQLDVVAAYLRAHPDLVGLVAEMAVALVAEFRRERSEIELAVYQDPEIDDRYLVFYVRLPEYDGSLMPRLDIVSERFDEGFTHASDLVLITTDYSPIK